MDGERIRIARIIRRMTQAQLAQKARIAQQDVSRIERGLHLTRKRTRLFERAGKICDILGLPR